MRATAISILSLSSLISVAALSLAACHGADEGAAEADKEAKAEQARAEKSGEVAKKIQPPVPGRGHVACDQLLDTAAFTTALGEKDPLTVKDVTASATEAAASCSLVRGGKPLSEAEQKALLKKGRLGVLPGDDVCNVTAYCWTLEDGEKFKQWCADKKLKADDSTGGFACVTVTARGEADVNNYKFFDDDTKCLLEVRGGPGMVDNAVIATCAKTARALITPAQIAVKGK
jgi:hypothetical protein